MGASGERVKVSEGQRLFELLRGIGLRLARQGHGRQLLGGGRILLLVCGKLLRVHSLDGSVTRGHFEKEKTTGLGTWSGGQERAVSQC